MASTEGQNRPAGSSNLSTKSLNVWQVAAYLDDVIVFDSDPTAYVKTIRALFEPLRKRNLKLSPKKAHLDTMDVNFPGYSFSPAGIRPNADKVSALMTTPVPKNLKQVRALMGGVGYYR